MRAGCLAFGQWRYYTLPTSGISDASITAVVSTIDGVGIGGLYVEQNRRPTEVQYAVQAERGTATADGLRVTVSPCDLRAPTTWHVAVFLEPQGERCT